jgi:hypothetical protein
MYNKNMYASGNMYVEDGTKYLDGTSTKLVSDLQYILKGPNRTKDEKEFIDGIIMHAKSFHYNENSAIGFPKPMSFLFSELSEFQKTFKTSLFDKIITNIRNGRYRVA